MSGYEDIIDLPYPRRPQRMSNYDRAAQFSPFAALTGYEAAIAETGRWTDSPVELDVDGKAMLDERIRELAANLSNQPSVKITYFIPDDRKAGGAYVTVSAAVRRIDRHGQQIQLEDGTLIDFDRIYEIVCERKSSDQTEKG